MTQYDDMLRSDPVLSKFMAVGERVKSKGVDRRGFIKLTGVAGGGLVLAFSLKGRVIGEAMAAEEAQNADLNAFVQVRPDNSIRIYSKNPEIGQGIKTALPMIVAEEMDASWETVVVEQAPLNPELFGAQIAGGSLSIPMNWQPMREAGATARHMLVAAAAKTWGVPAEEIETGDSMVRHGDKSATYGELAAEAAKMDVPDPKTLTFKERSEYKLLGTRITGVDNHALLTGKPLFGIDVQVPGMVYASYTKAQKLGAKVKSANLDHIKSLPGIEDAFIMEGSGTIDAYAQFNPTSPLYLPGVAIIGDSTGAVFAAKKELQVEWDHSGVVSEDSWTEFQAKAAELAKVEGDTETGIAGDPDKAFTDAAKTIDAFYTFNFVAHAQLEPQTTTAWVKEDGTVELWAPAQLPDQGVTAVSALLGIDKSQITFHQERVGGGFGRKLANDFQVEAAAIAQRVGKPVKLTWTREDDFYHDFYRPGGFNSFQAAFDADNNMIGWKDHFISFSPTGEVGPSGPPGAPPQEGPRPPSYFPAQLVSNARTTQTNLKSFTPTGPFRAPGSCTQAWVTQSFMHECAEAAGKDHVEFMLGILGEEGRYVGPEMPGTFHTGRAAGTIRKVAEISGWGRQLPAGRGLGLAFFFSHQGYVSQVAEVSVDSSKRVTVHKVWVAADVGPIVNLSGAENQCEGCVVDGISSLMLEVTMENGITEQSNFHQYPMRRIAGTPEIEVAFIQSDYPPTGLGEPGYPPAGPAICNAIYAATGERIRHLPISKQGFRI